MIPHFGIKRQYKNLREELLDATNDALKEGVWLEGPYSDLFKSWLAKKTKAKHVILCHSGTQALEIIAKHYKEHFLMDVIEIPNITYPATLNAFMNAGINVHLVDTDSNGLYIRNNASSGHITNPRTKTVACLVGLYGAHPVKANPMDIVDGAQHWLVAEDIGFAMAISFDPTKNLPCSGNGGAIVTNNSYVKDFAESYINNGKPNHMHYGTNSKLSELECSHLLVRTKYIGEWQDRRKDIRDFYISQFNNLPIRCLSKGHQLHADQKFVIDVDDRKALHEYLNDKGIESKIHYPYTLSELEISKIEVAEKPDMISVSSMLSRRVLSLPIYPELTDLEVEFIAEKVGKFFIHDK